MYWNRMNNLMETMSAEPVFKNRVMAHVSSSYRRAYSAALEDGPFTSLCSVLNAMTYALSDLLMPVCEYPCLIQRILPDDSPAKEMAQKIATATDRLWSVNQHLIRLCHGHEGLPLAVELGLLAQGVLDDLAQQDVSPSSVRVILETDGRPSVLHGPHHALYHLVRDMCLNAFSSMSDGGQLTVRIGSVAVDPSDVAHSLGIPADTHVCLQFRDDGPGIDPSCRDTLFDPFVSTTQGNGVGLGLSSVYRTVADFNGSILYNPDAGSGADFILLFPKATP